MGATLGGVRSSCMVLYRLEMEPDKRNHIDHVSHSGDLEFQIQGQKKRIAQDILQGRRKDFHVYTGRPEIISEVFPSYRPEFKHGHAVNRPRIYRSRGQYETVKGVFVEQ